jgi:hypothetical protein
MKKKNNSKGLKIGGNSKGLMYYCSELSSKIPRFSVVNQLTDKLIDEIISFVKTEYLKCYNAKLLTIYPHFTKFDMITKSMTNSNPWTIEDEDERLSSKVSEKYRKKWLEFYLNEVPKLFNRLYADEWIKKWIGSSTGKAKYNDLSVDIEKYFVKPAKSIIVYRGMSFNRNNVVQRLQQLSPNADFKKIKIGDTIECTFKDMSSWTKDIKIANDFSIKGHNTSDNEDFGIILETCANSKNSLLDVSAYGIKEKQSEIILKPGKYKCKIYLITNNKNNILNLSFGLYKDVII